MKSDTPAGIKESTSVRRICAIDRYTSLPRMQIMKRPPPCSTLKFSCPAQPIVALQFFVLLGWVDMDEATMGVSLTRLLRRATALKQVCVTQARKLGKS